MKKNKKRQKRVIRNRIILIAFIILIAIIVILINNNLKENAAVSADLDSKSEIFSNIRGVTAEVSKYIVYGTHLNLEGSINLTNSAIDNVKLVLKSGNSEEIMLDTDYEINDNTLEFTTGEIINEGLDLESLDRKSYYLLLKIVYTNGQDKYYSLENKTNYSNIDYYTITKNSENNKIYINFDEYNSVPYLNLAVSKVEKLPDDVYDIVIDPGHGGLDAGAVNGSYHEDDIALDCAQKLKTKLEELGLKVFLTRDGTEDENENTAYNMYDDNGRITKAMEANAKIFISLHMNSNQAYLSSGGVEVYTPGKFNYDFAQLLADNIVKMANTNYSHMTTNRVKNGVYMDNFTQNDIEQANEEAIAGGYEPYENITTDTSYLFMLRETGGIATGAYVDGRNTNYSANKYYNSNIGLESYLIELGYMSVQEDLDNILNNSDAYMQAVAESIKTQYLVSLLGQSPIYHFCLT